MLHHTVTKTGWGYCPPHSFDADPERAPDILHELEPNILHELKTQLKCLRGQFM